MVPFIAQITVFGCNFAPQGWALCQGQLLAISQYTALFSLIGTYYGGTGTSNFALPDLRSRAPIGLTGALQLCDRRNRRPKNRIDQHVVLPDALPWAVRRRQPRHDE